MLSIQPITTTDRRTLSTHSLTPYPTTLSPSFFLLSLSHSSHSPSLSLSHSLSVSFSVIPPQDMLMEDLAMNDDIDDEDVIDSEDIDLDLELQEALEGR